MSNITGLIRGVSTRPVFAERDEDLARRDSMGQLLAFIQYNMPSLLSGKKYTIQYIGEVIEKSTEPPFLEISVTNTMEIFAASVIDCEVGDAIERLPFLVPSMAGSYIHTGDGMTFAREYHYWRRVS